MLAGGDHDLVSVWDGDRCGPVQRRFHELVTDKIQHAQRQLAELTSFAAQLQNAAEQLSGPPIDGPCVDDCACLDSSATASTPASSVELVAKPTAVPIACTLGAGEMTDRMADWSAALGHAEARTPIAGGGLRVDFDAGLDVGELARVVSAERYCCSFFSFSITVNQRGMGLEVGVPEGAAEVVTALFGTPA